jgi:hypothetical protein
MANTDWTRLLDGYSLLAIKDFMTNNFVSYTKAQTLSEGQKLQARINIGANIEIVDLTSIDV